MRSLRILFLCHRFPWPPNRGGTIRPFNMIKRLTAQGHRVTVASLVRSAGEQRASAGMGDHCADYIVERVRASCAGARTLMRLPTAIPSSMGYFYSPRLAQRLRAALAEQPFDLIVVHCSSVAPYVADVQGVPKVLDFGDMDSQKWLAYAAVRPFPLSLGYRIEGIKLRHAEAALARRFDCCTCTTPAEVQTLDRYGTGVRCLCVPNGVDRAYFHPAEAPYDPDTLCFVGRMDYFPNAQGIRDFCATTLPLVRRRHPAVTLQIVGADPPRSVRALATQPGVTVTGTVADVRPYVHRSAVSVAPLLIARGTQNKILESMAMGVPVVASNVAAGGIDAVPGEHLLAASTPEAQATAICRLLDNPTERERLARAGRARVRSHHNWERIMTAFTAQLTQSLSLRTTNAPGGVRR